MRITLCTLASYRLPLRQPWISARGEFAVREGWLVRITSDTGRVGYGDCAPLPQAGTESMESATACLADWSAKLPGMSVEEALARIVALSPGSLPMGERDKVSLCESHINAVGMPAASCGLETALLDLLAQHAGVSLARWLNPHSSASVKINAVLGGLDRRVAGRALAATAEGYSVLKLKVGLATRHEEIPLLHDLASRLPGGVFLRLDANCAWNEGDAQNFLAGLAGLPVESVEDPLVNPDIEGWSRLQAQTPFPLAADESLRILGADEVFNQSPVRRVVLKPMVLGGTRLALAMARRAYEANMECVVTTTVDSAVGVTAALHLAAAVANDLSHGLATSAWLSHDIGEAPPVAGGVMRSGGIPGLGCCLAAR